MTYGTKIYHNNGFLHRRTIKIRLTDEQLKASEEYDDFGDFLSTLEEDYDFRVKDCLYMTCHNLTERNYNL